MRATLDSRLANGAVGGALLSERGGVAADRAAASEQAARCRPIGRRRVINVIFYVLRTGPPWHDLPNRYSPHTTVCNRYNRWAKAGVWWAVFEALAAKSPQSLHLIYSSIIHAHQHAAGRKGARITSSAVLVEDRASKSTPW